MAAQLQVSSDGSSAPTQEQDNRELYFHTVMDLDPEDHIVPIESRNIESDCAVYSDSDESTDDTSSTTTKTLNVLPSYRYPLLQEQCERVIGSVAPTLVPLNMHGFHTLENVTDSVELKSDIISAEPWLFPNNNAALSKFIASSRFNTTLQAVRTLAAGNPDVLLTMLTGLMRQARQVASVQDRLTRIVDQLAHKYPRMNVLALTDPSMSLTEHVLAGLGKAFVSYTCGIELEKNIGQRVGAETMSKVTTTMPDWTDDDDNTDHPAGTKYDLVVLSSKLVAFSKSAFLLKQLLRVMKQGGFLIIVDEATKSLESCILRPAGDEQVIDGPGTISDWLDCLANAGFLEPGSNSHQSFPPRLSIIVRQTPCEGKQLMRQLSWPRPAINKVLTSGILLIGGHTTELSHVVLKLRTNLEPLCSSFHHAPSLDNLDVETAKSFDSVVFIADLETDVLCSATDHTLDVLKALLRPEATVLWVTHNASVGDAENAASFGFARTILVETPGLVLQMLDFDILKGASRHITEAFARLLLSKSVDMSDALYVHEPEIHMQFGRRFVPRVLPFDGPNKRHNAVRRTVTETMDSLNEVIKVVPTTSADGAHRLSATRTTVPTGTQAHGGGSGDSDYVLVQVQYSVLLPVTIRNQKQEMFICYGVDMDAADLDHVVCLSEQNASVVKVISDLVIDVETSPEPDQFCGRLAAALFISAMISAEETKAFILINASKSMVQLAFEAWTREIDIQRWTTDESEKDDLKVTFVDPKIAARDLAEMFPDEAFAIFDFSSSKFSAFSDLVKKLLPEDCRYNPDPTMPWTAGEFKELAPTTAHVASLLAAAYEAAQRPPTYISKTKDFPVLSVPMVLKLDMTIDPIVVIDWRQERIIEAPISPEVDVFKAFDKHGIYVLVGLNNDLSESLCRFFVSKGAKSLVVACQDLPENLQWPAEIEASQDGVKIVVESVDVTDLDSVYEFKTRVSAHFPRDHVRGVISDATVLDERPFSQMTAAHLHQVLRPKIVGSDNLDQVFDDFGIRFFIMFSSFAAIGGHAGQSHRAAANMYVNGLAAARRARRLPASVLNVGVVVGLGLQGERTALYAELEREGYPLVSEHDLHHMFLETIRCGQPDANQIKGLTTWLRPVRNVDEHPVAWQRDPRFSHLAVD